MTVHAQSRMRLKCIYLSVALENALEGFYAKEVTIWSKPCKKAIDSLRYVPLGLPAIAIMNHDNIFIIDDSDNEDNGDSVLKSEVEQGTAILSDRFNEIAHEMSSSKKGKRKKNLILKGLVQSNATKAYFSLDTKEIKI
eukprot:1577198-Ditylum_brightwellii.AAC.1